MNEVRVTPDSLKHLKTFSKLDVDHPILYAVRLSHTEASKLISRVAQNPQLSLYTEIELIGNLVRGCLLFT